MDSRRSNTRRDGGIARITLNRPERLNAINTQLVADLRAPSARGERGPVRAGDDPERRRPGVLRRLRPRLGDEGRGRGAAGDVRQWDPVRDYLGMSRNVRAYMSLWESPKPVIAQVHGWCVGGGTDLALCSDLIFMAEDASDRLPAGARLG